uniref:Putative endonuclease subunit n=1 Tax=viral metagenome TaxID=1070528 RepID=A0A6M3L9Z9_9ZZZZ
MVERQRTEETKQKISESIKNGYLNGRIGWNKNKHIQTNTGRTHFKKGYIPWNKGLTKENDTRVLSVSNKVKGLRKGKTYEQIYGKEKSLLVLEKIRTKKEIRFCKCGCGFSKECKITSDWKYSRNHDKRKVQVEKKCICGNIFFTSLKLPKKYCSRKCRYSDSNFFKQISKRSNITKKQRGTYLERHGIEKWNLLKSKQSNIKVQGILNKTYNPTKYRKKFKQGHFFSNKNNKNLYYRSSLELFVFQVLESLSEVVSFDSEVIRIPYKFNDCEYAYVVDLIVKYKNGQTDLIEVKGTWGINEERTQEKIKAGILFAKNNGWNFKLITEKDIQKQKRTNASCLISS